MAFVHSMASGAQDAAQKRSHFFDSATGFFEKLANDPAALNHPGVRRLILFIASDFGKGEIPPFDVPTIDLIRGEIDHLNAERKAER